MSDNYTGDDFSYEKIYPMVINGGTIRAYQSTEQIGQITFNGSLLSWSPSFKNIAPGNYYVLVYLMNYNHTNKNPLLTKTKYTNNIAQTPSSIVLNLPLGGSEIMQGNPLNVSWASSWPLDVYITDMNDKVLPNFSVKNNNTTLVSFLTSGIASNYYIPVGQYRIKACFPDTNNCAYSATPFSIVAPPVINNLVNYSWKTGDSSNVNNFPFSRISLVNPPGKSQSYQISSGGGEAIPIMIDRILYAYLLNDSINIDHVRDNFISGYTKTGQIVIKSRDENKFLITKYDFSQIKTSALKADYFMNGYPIDPVVFNLNIPKKTDGWISADGSTQLINNFSKQVTTAPGKYDVYLIDSDAPFTDLPRVLNATPTSNILTINLSDSVSPQITSISSPGTPFDFNTGDKVTVSWGPSSLSSFGTVILGVQGDGVTSTLPFTQIATLPFSAGSYTWTVPAVLGSESLAGKKYQFVAKWINASDVSSAFSVRAPLPSH